MRGRFKSVLKTRTFTVWRTTKKSFEDEDEDEYDDEDD